MGILYSALPVCNQVAEHLRGFDIDYPEPLPESRNPTLKEVREACSQLLGVHVAQYEGFGIQIHLKDTTDSLNQTQTTLTINGYSGDENKQHAIGFEEGCIKLILRALVMLTAYTGPLALFSDADDRPILIKSSDDPDQLLKQWM